MAREKYIRTKWVEISPKKKNTKKASTHTHKLSYTHTHTVSVEDDAIVSTGTGNPRWCRNRNCGAGPSCRTGPSPDELWFLRHNL